VTRVARRSALLRVLRELGVAGEPPATREGAVEFRCALQELRPMLAFVLGLYTIWKMIRTTGEL
jgi:hypothetical protein